MKQRQANPRRKDSGRLPPLAAVAAGLVLLVPALPQAASVAEGNPLVLAVAEVRHAPDPQSAKAQFLQTGRLTVAVPRDGDVAPNGRLTIEGRAEPLYAESTILEFGADPDEPPTVLGRTSSVALTGTAEGRKAGAATLLLGEFGIYGDVAYPSFDGITRKTLLFDVWPRDEARPEAGLVQVVRLRVEERVVPESEAGRPTDDVEADALLRGNSPAEEWDPDPPLDGAPADGHCPRTGSTVLMVAEKSFSSAHSNWVDRIDSAANKYRSLFKGVCIDLSIQRVGLKFSFTSYKCSEYKSGPYLLHDFQNHLDAHNWPQAFRDVDAFQLWTGRDLKNPGKGPNGAYCYGSAKSNSALLKTWDSTTRVRNGHLAASVVEGVDVNKYDGYDPDEVHERGIVSGHELAHNYGEGNHPTHCKKRCNIMKRGEFQDNLDFYFTDGSKTEIKNWYFHGIA